jgi:Flp pilus assembly CpaE family ATPase
MITKREDPMPRMRLLLESDPSLPADVRRAISRGDHDAHTRLVDLGLNECEAAELLDEHPRQEWLCA